MGRGRPKKNVAETQAVVEQVKTLSLEGVSKKIAATQVEVQKNLVELTSKLANHLQELDDVCEAVESKKAELQTLYDVEVTLESIESIRANAEESRKRWQEEETEHQLNKRREADKWNYDTAKAHQDKLAKLEEIEYNTALANRKRKEELDKSWALREETLKKQEDEVKELRKQVADFPKKLDDTCEKVRHVAEAKVKGDFETKLTLLQKDLDNQNKLHAQRSTDLENQISFLKAENSKLVEALNKANEQVAAIAKSAAESSSGKHIVQDIVRELSSNKSEGVAEKGRR